LPLSDKTTAAALHPTYQSQSLWAAPTLPSQLLLALAILALLEPMVPLFVGAGEFENDTFILISSHSHGAEAMRPAFFHLHSCRAYL
jgi:hypothetical protein